jgi:tRNA-specific 2-thiouridylase
LLGRGVIGRQLNWLGEPPGLGSRLAVQVRHRALAATAEVVRLDDDEIELALDEPLAAITPGQSMVLYDGTRVLGGGIIEGAQRIRAPLPILAA